MRFAGLAPIHSDQMSDKFDPCMVSGGGGQTFVAGQQHGV
jgi:hypothetical protein